MADLYVPTGGCSGCPGRGVCHSARQRVHDRSIEAGRHYLCPFYGQIERSTNRRAGGFLNALRRLLLSGE